MKISKDKTSVYSCQYSICIAPKFFEVSIKNIPNFVEVLEEASVELGLSIWDIAIFEELLCFKIDISPSETVLSNVNRLKRKMTDKLFEAKSIDKKPIFSTSFHCSTIEGNVNLLKYKELLKKSYRSTKGELL